MTIPAPPDVETASERASPRPDFDGAFDLVLKPPRRLAPFPIEGLASFRELLYFLTWRDIKVRYKQTILGVLWAVLQPVLAAVLFTVVFGHVAKISSGDIPYPLFVYAALVPWFFFANSTQLASNSLIVNPQLITKVYFPRILLVTAPILAGLIDVAFAAVVLLGMVAYYGTSPDLVGVLVLLPLMVLALVTTIGLGAWLAALNVRYRDVRFIVPFLLQILLFLTPVVYSAASLGEPWSRLYALNPMSTVVEGFRWALAGGPALDGVTVFLSVASALLLLALGTAYFGRTERVFADVI